MCTLGSDTFTARSSYAPPTLEYIDYSLRPRPPVNPGPGVLAFRCFIHSQFEPTMELWMERIQTHRLTSGLLVPLLSVLGCTRWRTYISKSQPEVGCGEGITFVRPSRPELALYQTFSKLYSRKIWRVSLSVVVSVTVSLPLGVWV